MPEHAFQIILNSVPEALTMPTNTVIMFELGQLYSFLELRLKQSRERSWVYCLIQQKAAILG